MARPVFKVRLYDNLILLSVCTIGGRTFNRIPGNHHVFFQELANQIHCYMTGLGPNPNLTLAYNSGDAEAERTPPSHPPCNLTLTHNSPPG